MNFLLQIDHYLFFLFYRLVDFGYVPTYFVVFFAGYFQYVLILFLVYLFFRKRDNINSKVMVVLALLSALFARLVFKSLILLFVNRERPFVSFAEEVDAIIRTSSWENLQSFPSGHAVFFFALATVIFDFDRRLGKWFFLAVTIMGIARVMAGVHWPSDVLVGAFIGVLVGRFGVFIYKIYKDKLDFWFASVWKRIS